MILLGCSIIIHGTVNEAINIITSKRGEHGNWKDFKYTFTPNAQITALNHGENKKTIKDS